MEEKPPTQAGRDVPRSRTPRTAVNTPDQPTPASKPAERTPRRTKAAPAVTFQAPADDAATDSSSEDPSDKPAPRRRPAQRRSEPANNSNADATGAEEAPAKRTSKTTAAPPAKKGTEPTPAAKPAKATKATKRAPKKVPAQTGTPARAKKATAKATPAATEQVDAVPAQPAVDAVPPAKATTAATEQVDAVPAQPAVDAVPPAKAMPAQAGPVDATPVDTANDPAPAQPAADAITPAKAAPAKAVAPSEETPEAEQRQPGTITKLVGDPGHAPELLALAAVQSIGPRAKEWAKRTREAYPHATDAALARLAADQFTRFSSPSSIVGTLAGAYAPVSLIATTALTHARVILHVAAAYGIDPTDEARAADLLVLTRVHASREDADTALAATGQGAAGKSRIARMVATNAAGWVVVRLVSRYIPGTRLLAAALVNRSSARAMAERANRYYSQASHALGSSV